LRLKQLYIYLYILYYFRCRNPCDFIYEETRNFDKIWYFTSTVCRVTLIYNSKFKQSSYKKVRYQLNNKITSALVFSLLGTFAKFRKAIICFVMPVCPSLRPSAWRNSAPNKREFIKLDIWISFSKQFQGKLSVIRIIED
jgi:hypothetical protein